MVDGNHAERRGSRTTKFPSLVARAYRGLCRGGCYPASSPGVGWMTMRLDPVPCTHMGSLPRAYRPVRRRHGHSRHPATGRKLFSRFLCSVRRSSVPPIYLGINIAMEPFVYCGIIFTALMASAMTFLIVRLLDRLRRRDAESEAAEIVRKAQEEVENRRREAELEIKEMMLKQQEESEKELRKTPRRTPRTRTPARQTPGRPGRAGRTAPQAGEDGREAPSASSPRRSRRPTAARRSSPSCSTCSGRRCTSSAA